MEWMADKCEIERVVKSYENLIAHIALHYLQNWADSEDVVQNVIIKWAQKKRSFTSPEHEKAWFIRVTINICKDILRSSWLKRTILKECVGTDFRSSPSESNNIDNDMLKAVLALPPNYRITIYLHYYEEFSIRQIACYLKKSENTVHTWHRRAKILLKKRLGEMKDGLDEI